MGQGNLEHEGSQLTINAGVEPEEKTPLIGGSLTYPRWYIPKRHVMVVLCFLATTICYLLRTNMSVAILPMEDKYKWGSSTAAIVLSSFFWGYIILQLPGSWLAYRFGGKMVLGVGVLWTSIFTILTPIAAHYFPLLLLCRFFTGFAEAVTYPVIIQIMSDWAPPSERTRFVAFIWTGSNIGTIAAMSTSSPLINLVGYENLFYMNGACGLLWTLLWFLVASNKPRDMWGICEAEIKFITAPMSAAVLPTASAMTINGRPNLNVSTVKKLCTNKHLWAIYISNFCTNWGFYVLLTWIPTYMHKQLKFDIAKSTVMEVLPYIGLFVVGTISGRFSDLLIRRGADLTLIRKTFGVLGCALPAIFLVGLGFVSQVQVALVCMVLAVALHGANYAALGPNVLDVAPKYAGIVLGISNTIGTIPGIVGVYLTGWMLEQFDSWAMVFILAAIIYGVNCLTWAVLCTTKRIF